MNRKASRKLRKSLITLAMTLILLAFGWAAEMLSTPLLPSSNDPPLLYSNLGQDDLLLTFTGAIQQARKSVLLIIYSLSDPKIIAALKDKALQGVDVKVICDGHASSSAANKLGPNIAVLKRYGDGLMHLKILVVDGEQTWIGSANMTTESLKMHANLVTAFQDPSLAACVITKAELMPQDGRSGTVPTQKFSIGGQEVELWFLPDNPDAPEKIKELISSAKKTIRAALFTWTRLDFAQEILKASLRGVKVEIVIDRYAGNGSSAKVAKFLKENGIPTYFNQGNGLLHHKFLYIDNHTLLNGSANWTKAAFKRNDDCFIVLHNLSEKQQTQMETLWNIMRQESVRQ